MMKVALALHETLGLDRTSDLLLGGVPFGRGALAAGGWFRLRRSDGAEFLLEGTPAARWPDGSVKWLHVCGLVDVKGGQANAFSLECAAAAPSPDGLTVVGNDGRVCITGPALEVTLSTDPAAVLAVQDRSGTNPRPLLRGPGLSGTLVLAGPDGANRREFRLEFGDGAPTVRVQTATRVVVRLPGRFTDAQGTVLAELITFVEVLRGVPELRLQPVLIYLGTPRTDLVAALTLTVHTALGGADTEYAFANERGRGYRDVLQRLEGGPRWPTARQVQLGSSFYRTEKRVCPEGSWVKAAEGGRSQGWCQLRGRDAAVTAATRYFWQEYPHSHTIDLDAGTITFGLVPPEAAPLDLRRYSPVVYGAAVYESGEGPFEGRYHGAHGIGKAHELLLRFHVRGDADDGPQRALCFTHPLRPLAAPEHVAGTAVVGRIAAAVPPCDAAIEAKLAQTVDFLIGERAVRNWYGLMDFGDIMIAYYADRDTWAFDDGGYAWLNTEHIPDYGLWLSALRAGRPDWLEAAIEMSRHNRDVDTYHRGQVRGCGSRHNVNHWGCPDKEWRVSMPLARRLHYYLTADPWTAEVIVNTVAVYQSYERTSRAAPSMSAALAGLLAKWEMSTDPADGEALRNLAGVFARAVRDDGLWTAQLHVNLATGMGEPTGSAVDTSHFFMRGFGGQHTLVEIAELLEHRELSAALVRHVRAMLAANPERAHRDLLPFLAHAYRQTGDPALLEAIRTAVAQVDIGLRELGGDGPLDEPRHAALRGGKRTNKIACALGDALHTVPYGLAALCATRGAP